MSSPTTSAVSPEVDYAADVYALTPRDGALTALLRDAFLAGVRWEARQWKPPAHTCRECDAIVFGGVYCDDHRYNPCTQCEKLMRRNGQKLVDHPGTVARNTKDTCASCYAKARRAGEYTADLALSPEDVRAVSRLINARFEGNDRLTILNALGIDTLVEV